MREMAHTYLIMPSVLAATEEAWQAPGTRVEFFLQVFDNAYMSILFLYKIREARKRTKRISAVGFHRSSYGSKLRTLFWIAASNFVFPVMLSLAQIIFLYVASDNFNAVYVALLFFVNDIVEIVCALLATLLVVGNRVQESIDAEKKIVIDLSSTTVARL
ncbi:hypothetical protein EW026_g4309 [Hermanssonia centrifuga]|uniref:Uncharacterized protein n=1 Tax=Hermanssonia centrifuga TaxID=98765 RepID=A0A4S4KHK4_9APHY|nr:hypothetical protein EW026_g4309 [Hermanssonia centrifuga]